jgi:hypothetical protein
VSLFAGVSASSMMDARAWSRSGVGWYMTNAKWSCCSGLIPAASKTVVDYCANFESRHTCDPFFFCQIIVIIGESFKKEKGKGQSAGNNHYNA